MSWVAAAIGGSALIGAGTGLYSANRAADAQAGASQQALAYQQQTDQRNQANAAPYMSLGAGAAGKIGALYSGNGTGAGGINGSGWQDFTNSPDYQFAFQQGASALQNSAAAKGGLLSGNFARGITDYGQGMASQQFGNYYNRLYGQAQLGQSAASGLAGTSTAAAGQIGGTMQGIGQANASGIVGGANAVTGSLSNGVNNYLFNNAINRSSFGGSGGGAGGGNALANTGYYSYGAGGLA